MSAFKAAVRSTLAAAVCLASVGCVDAWAPPTPTQGIVVGVSNDANDGRYLGGDRGDNLDDFHTGALFAQYVIEFGASRWEVTSVMDALTDKARNVRQDVVRLEIARTMHRSGGAVRVGMGTLATGDLGGQRTQNWLHTQIDNDCLTLDYGLSERFGTYACVAGETRLVSRNGFTARAFADGTLSGAWWPHSASVGVGVAYTGPHTAGGFSFSFGFRQGYRWYGVGDPEAARWFGEQGTMKSFHFGVHREHAYALRIYVSRDPYCLDIEEIGFQQVFGAAARASRSMTVGPNAVF